MPRDGSTSSRQHFRAIFARLTSPLSSKHKGAHGDPTQLPKSQGELSKASWSTVEKTMTGNPINRAFRQHTDDLSQAYIKACRDRGLDLEADLGIKSSIEDFEVKFLAAPWVHAFSKTEDDLATMAHNLSDPGIWPQLKGAEREMHKTTYSHMLEMFKSGQVPIKQDSLIHYDEKTESFQCNTGATIEQLAEEMRDHQYNWYQKQVPDATSTLTSKLLTDMIVGEYSKIQEGWAR